MKLTLIFVLLFVNFLLISGNIAFALYESNNSSRTNNVEFIATQLTPQVVPTGLQRIGGDLVQTIDNFVDADIAIMDVGTESHRDLNVFRRFNAVNPGTGYRIECKHGTHVAGIAGAKNDESGIVGTAPGARIWDIKIAECNPLTSEPMNVADRSLLNALDYVIDNSDQIDVLNISYNEHCPTLCNPQSYRAYQLRIDRIVDSGIVVVSSAGNDNNVADRYIPPKFENVITVSAISDSDGKCGGSGDRTSQGEDDRIATDSNYGDGVDIAAPGIDILSTIPNNRYGFMSGTSMAAPYVSGTAALIISNNPGIEPDEVRDMILNAGSNFQTECDGRGHGYFEDYKDQLHEPLLYIRDLISN